MTRKPRTLAQAVRRAVLTPVLLLVGLVVGFTGTQALTEVGILPEFGVVVSGPESASPAPTEAPEPSRAERLFERFECSTSGLPEGVIPGSALVRDETGRVRVTTFDYGWKVYAEGVEGETLAAVCRKAVRP